jgi:integrase
LNQHGLRQLPPPLQQEPEIIYSVTDGLSSSYTKREYRRNFKRFLDRWKMSPEDLLNQARENPRLTESTIINYIRHLAEEEKLMHKTIHVHCYAIFHFLEMNDINLNKKKIKRFVPPDESSQDDRAYTHDEIANILLKCDDRTRVIILLMVSTGMRVGAIHVLQIIDLVKIEGYGLYKITVYSNSSKDRYYTFCTPECTRAIDSYLDYRMRLGEIIKPQAPLVREQFDINDPFHITRPHNLKHDTVTYIIKQVLKRSGKKTGEVMQTHGFRKFAITMNRWFNYLLDSF